MAIADLGRIFRVAVRNKKATTATPPRNGIKSNADCCVMQCLDSYQEPRADIGPSKKMAAAKRSVRLPGVEQCQNVLGPPGAWSPDTRVPIRQMTSRVLQRMQPRS